VNGLGDLGRSILVPLHDVRPAPYRPRKKKAAPEGAAKFREETSKKADSAVDDRIAAMHNVAMARIQFKGHFAVQREIALDNCVTDE